MEKEINRPNQLERNYGDDRETNGYSKGYNQCTYDARRRKAFKEKSLYRQFSQYLDWLSDRQWENRRR